MECFEVALRRGLATSESDNKALATRAKDRHRQAPKRGPGQGIKTRKRSGTAAPNGPKTESKRSHLGAENGTSETRKKKL